MANVIVDAINAQARVLKKVVTALKEQDALIGPGKRTSDILNDVDLVNLEVQVDEMINPGEPVVL